MGRHPNILKLAGLAMLILGTFIVRHVSFRSQDGPWRIEASHVIMSKFSTLWPASRLDHVRLG